MRRWPGYGPSSGRALSAPEEVVVSDSLVWERPHPLTLVVELIEALKQLALPIIFVLFQGRGGGLGDLGDAVIIMAPLTIAGARFWSTRYAIDDEAVYHRHGVFNRTQQVLPRRNIQNVSTRAQLIARATGLVELQISDASAEGDINLRLLSVMDAERIAALLRSGPAWQVPPPPGRGGTSDSDHPSSGLVPGPDGALVPPPPREPMITTSARQLVLASVGNGLAIGPVIFTTVLTVGVVVLVLSIGRPSLVENLGLIGGVAIPLFLLTVPARIITPILRLAGFRLWADPDRIRTQAGLFTEQKTAARRERVQLVQVDRRAAMRLLGVERVRFATADLEGFDGSAVTYLNPGGPIDEWPVVAAEVLGHLEHDDDALTRVSPLTRRRAMVRFVLLTGALVPAVVALVLTDHGVLAALLVAFMAALLLFGDWYSRRRYERLGYAVGASQLMTRTGALDETLKILRKEKVQSLRLEESFFQRRLGLASLLIGTAGSASLGSVFLPDLDLAVAQELAHHLALASSMTRLSDTI